MGDPLNDYFPGLGNKNPVNAAKALTPGYGPNTLVIMRFGVKPTSTMPADPPLHIITKATDLTVGNDPLLATPRRDVAPA